MAQLVERTLGKGEVPSSTLGISTTLKKTPLRRGFCFGIFIYSGNLGGDDYLIGAAQGLVVAEHGLMIQIAS